MQEEIVTFRDLPVYDHNPFIEPIVAIKTKRKTVQISSSPGALFNEDGDHVGDKLMMVTKKVDNEEFVKVFKNQISLIFELSKTAQKVLSYFIKNLGINKDYVIFDRKKAREITGLSSDASIYSGLFELVQKNVIAKSNITLMYFINPAIIFNGDRLAVINVWVKDKQLGDTNSKNMEDWPENDQKQLNP